MKHQKKQNHRSKVQKKLKSFNSSFLISCPVCGQRTFTVTQRIDNIPYFGEVLETFASCSSCRYKTGDVLPFEERNAPTNQKVKILKEADLKRRVIKSHSCTIEIPEINLKIEPGPDSEAYITNVEGLLDRIMENIGIMETAHPEKKKEFDKVMKELTLMKEGKKHFTLKLSDSTGISLIL